MVQSKRPFAIVTGAASGIGYELAKCCAQEGYDLLIADEEPRIHDVAKELQTFHVLTEAVETDLSTFAGVDNLCAITQRPVDALLANAGPGLGKSFLEQNPDEWRRVIDTNLTGTLYLVQKTALGMRNCGKGRILITGSIAGFLPGTYQAVYNGIKAFLDSFSFALRHELKGTGITVTCLMPGATQTEFFERAGLTDTRTGQARKDDAARIARLGYEAMVDGDGEVITGWQNKMRAAIGAFMPADFANDMHQDLTKPGARSTAH